MKNKKGILEYHKERMSRKGTMTEKSPKKSKDYRKKLKTKNKRKKLMKKRTFIIFKTYYYSLEFV